MDIITCRVGVGGAHEGQMKPALGRLASTSIWFNFPVGVTGLETDTRTSIQENIAFYT